MIKSQLDEEIRQKILKNPDLILLDQEVFMSLINEKNFSDEENIVDIRNAFLKRLGSKLEKLKDANNKIIKNAYENQLSVSKIHKCCLSIINSTTRNEIFSTIFNEFPTSLQINSVKLVLDKDTKLNISDPKIIYKSNNLISNLSKFVGLTKSRLVILRENLEYEQRHELGLSSFDDKMESEAILSIKIKNKLIGLIFFESKNKKTFSIDQATDYLEFLCKIIYKRIEQLK